MIRALLTCAVLMVLACFVPAHAQSTSDALLTENEKRIEIIRTRFRAVQIAAGGDTITEEQADKQRTMIDALRLEVIAEEAKLASPLTELQEQVLRLGEPPAAGTTEAPAMAAQRKLLGSRISRLVASQKQLELLRLELDQTTNRLLVQQRNRFFESIFRSDLSVLNPRLWLQTIEGGGRLAGGINEQLRSWSRETGQNANPFGFLLIPLAALLLYSLWNVLKKRIGQNLRNWGWLAHEGAETPSVVAQISPLKRLLQVCVGLVACSLFLSGTHLVLVSALSISNVYTESAKPFVDAFIRVIGPPIFQTVLIYLICAPGRPEARIVPIQERAARTLPLLVFLLSLAYSLSRVLSDVANLLNIPVDLTAGQIALAAAIMIFLLGLALVIIRREANIGFSEGQSYFLTWIVKVLPVLWLFLAASAIALVLGYISLAYFIVGNIVDTIVVAMVIALVHYLADAAADSMLNPASSLGSTLRSVTGWGEKGVARLSLFFRTAVDIMLVLLAIPTLIGIWALSWIDITSFYAKFFSGFTVGNITISPTGLGIAAFVLAIGVAITRSLTGWLQRRVLSETKLDKGVQDSVRTASSYLGYIIASAVALSAAGIDFSNIAIIAGALGVGIGFGLQSIVNNFVSGLILLAERPIRVGDWVETDKGDGIVKKINVRSTEIETFDSCTVFIPNSTLITQSVKNWTHRDTVGRISVSVLVDHMNNTDKVRDTLLEIVRQHPKILRYPEPSVMFSKFAATGFEFDVKGFVADLFEGPRTSSELRLMISRTFEEKKIKLAKA
jgi:potassium-dependent mechanosensitive channel